MTVNFQLTKLEPTALQAVVVQFIGKTKSFIGGGTSFPKPILIKEAKFI